MNAIVQATIDQINATNGVVDSAIVLINSISQRIQDAVQQAIANGATAAELAPLTQLDADLQAKTQALAAAVAANP